LKGHAATVTEIFYNFPETYYIFQNIFWAHNIWGLIVDHAHMISYWL